MKKIYLLLAFMLAVIACKSVENEVNTTAPAAEDAVCDNPLGFCPDSLE